MYSLARPKSGKEEGKVCDPCADSRCVLMTHLLYVLFYHVYLNFYRLENFLASHLYKLNADYARTRSYEAVDDEEGRRRRKFIRLVLKKKFK